MVAAVLEEIGFQLSVFLRRERGDEGLEFWMDGDGARHGGSSRGSQVEGGSAHKPACRSYSAKTPCRDK
jgi:hypothetical protein